MAIVENHRDTKAGRYYTIVIGGVTIYDCKHVQTGEHDFIAMPQRSYEKDGKTKYVSLVRLDDETSAEVRAAVKAYEAGESAPDDTSDLEPF